MVDDKARPRQSAAVTKGKGQPGIPSVLAKALLPTLLLAGLTAAGAYARSGGWANPGDDISPSEAQTRLETFHTLDALLASKVPPADIERALDDMRLSPSAQQSLRSDLGLPAPAVQAQAHPAPRRVQLIWLRLWDTDAEDGDVVRIDSAGYSRVVRLTKHGDTFAVPVSGDDVIRVTGIKDGDGGGITLGLASGSSQAVFPIMSEGQVLGLKVKVD